MLYLGGPMTGIPDFNYPLFKEVAEWLRFPTRGYEVRCPAEIDGGNQVLEGGEVQPWKYYMRHALRMLLECDSIALLPGWEKSKGARRELDIALDLEYDVYLIRVIDFPDGNLYGLEKVCS